MQKIRFERYRISKIAQINAAKPCVDAKPCVGEELLELLDEDVPTIYKNGYPPPIFPP
jgi:hypothetical protein